MKHFNAKEGYELVPVKGKGRKQGGWEQRPRTAQDDIADRDLLVEALGKLEAGADARAKAAEAKLARATTTRKLRPVERAILTALAQATTTLTAEKLERVCKVDGASPTDKTIRKYLAQFIRDGWVERPHGSKGGVAITPAGRDALLTG